jgi:hypothetical protein
MLDAMHLACLGEPFQLGPATEIDIAMRRDDRGIENAGKSLFETRLARNFYDILSGFGDPKYLSKHGRLVCFRRKPNGFVPFPSIRHKGEGVSAQNKHIAKLPRSVIRNTSVEEVSLFMPDA